MKKVIFMLFVLVSGFSASAQTVVTKTVIKRPAHPVVVVPAPGAVVIEKKKVHRHFKRRAVKRHTVIVPGPPPHPRVKVIVPPR